MRRVWRGARRLGGFGASVLLTGAANVLTIPLLVSAIGSSAWANLATAQAVGAIAAILVQLGWGVLGPAEIAAMKSGFERTHTYARSAVVRMGLFAVVAPVAGVVTAIILGDGSEWASILAAIGTAATGLSANWYLTGTGSPARLILLDTAPRATIIILASVATYVSGDALYFGAGLVCASIAPFAIASASIIPSIQIAHEAAAAVFRDPVGSVRGQLRGVSTSLVSSTYKYLPLIAVSLSAPSVAAEYALLDRMVKFAIGAARPLGQVMQGWVPAGGPVRLSERVRVAALLATGGGVIAAVGFVLIAPTLAQLLGLGQIQLSLPIAIAGGVTLGASICSQTLGIACLVALGRSTMVAISAIAGGVVCLVSVWSFTELWGATGAAVSVALAEFVVLLVQSIAIYRSLRRRR